MSVRPRKLRSRSGKAVARTRGTIAKVPGPSSNSATNFMIMDIAVRGLSMIAARGIEKGLLRTRYDPDKAADIVKGRPMLQSLASAGAARMATRSVPGFLLVTGGLLAKAVLDRSFGRRKSVRRGEQQLAEQAAKADE